MTNHDVKAIEYVLKQRFEADSELSKVVAHRLPCSKTPTGPTAGQEAMAALW